jgi:hypothetical protein
MPTRPKKLPERKIVAMSLRPELHDEAQGIANEKGVKLAAYAQDALLAAVKRDRRAKRG